MKIRDCHFRYYPVTMGVLLLCVLSALSGASAGQSSGARFRSPYPPSPVIAGIQFDWDSHQQRAPGSDNWPLTWADDGHQYAAWGDGGGFGGTNSRGRVSLGVARIEGSSDHYTGHNVWGGYNAEHPARFGGKSYGILCLRGVLYMWVSPGSGEENYREARLAFSTDHGATWTRAHWVFTQADELVLPTFCQFGRNYAGAADNYVYIYATRLPSSAPKPPAPAAIDLMRVPVPRLLERDAYRFFAGFNHRGKPLWSADIADRVPAFTDPNGCRLVSVSYNPGLRRYLLCTAHGPFAKGNLGIFDAPSPWGPWTTVAYYTCWGGFDTTFFWSFPTKWLSTDGTRFTMVFTGTGAYDAWNTIRGKFLLRHNTGP